MHGLRALTDTSSELLVVIGPLVTSPPSSAALSVLLQPPVCGEGTGFSPPSCLLLWGWLGHTPLKCTNMRAQGTPAWVPTSQKDPECPVNVSGMKPRLCFQGRNNPPQDTTLWQRHYLELKADATKAPSSPSLPKNRV